MRSECRVGPARFGAQAHHERRVARTVGLRPKRLVPPYEGSLTSRRSTINPPAPLIMHKYWVVLKVSLTRPWVWMMLSFFPASLVFPWMHLKGEGRLPEAMVAIPTFDVPDVTVNFANEPLEFAMQDTLGAVQGLNTRDLPGDLVISDDGKYEQLLEPRGVTPLVKPTGEWPILSQFPQLKSLTMQPPNLLGPKGLKRIGQLSNLESLSLENIGSSDFKAVKTAGADLHSALSKLTKLRQLNVNNTCANFDWTLPPLPQLEYVVLGFNFQLAETLETLADNSPKLHTITLTGYQDANLSDRMLAAIRKMSRLRHVYIVSSSKPKDLDETSRQLEFLRARLPGIAVHRGAYSIRRLMVCAFILFQAMFISFLAWFQSGLTLAQPLAAVMPGHRRPHLFWPLAASFCALVVFVVGASFMGVFFPVALAMGCMGAMLVAMILPGHDLTSEWRRITSIVSTVDMLSLFTLMGVGLGLPLTMDAFLLGDYPILASLLMVWFPAAAVWKIVRTGRLHRILAESGMPGIPGLNLSMQELHNQPFKPAPGWSLAGWQLKRMETAIDRRIARMDRTSWVDMLRRASPSNPGMLIGIGAMVVFIVVFQSMPWMRNSNAPKTMPYTIGMMQAMMMILMMTAMMWVGRRSSIAADFLRPISRPKFWNALRLAIFHDLKWGILFGLGWGLFSLSMANKGAISPLTVAITVTTATGFFAFYHAWLTLIVIGKRLWLHATLAVVSSAVVTGMTVAAPVITFGEQADPLIAILLAFGVLAAGGLMQWGVARKLPNWELGA